MRTDGCPTWPPSSWILTRVHLLSNPKTTRLPTIFPCNLRALRHRLGSKWDSASRAVHLIHFDFVPFLSRLFPCVVGQSASKCFCFRRTLSHVVCQEPLFIFLLLPAPFYFSIPQGMGYLLIRFPFVCVYPNNIITYRSRTTTSTWWSPLVFPFPSFNMWMTIDETKAAAILFRNFRWGPSFDALFSFLFFLFILFGYSGACLPAVPRVS